MTRSMTPRPTTYKGIAMRSRLEAGFAAWLDSMNFDWEYEPKAFASERGQYLPDFRINRLRCVGLQEPVDAYVEVKPKGWPFDGDVEPLYRSMAIIWESEPDAVLLLCMDDDFAPFGFLDSVRLLRKDLSPADDPAFPWPCHAIWVRPYNPAEPLFLGYGLARQQGPWRDEYWKVSF